MLTAEDRITLSRIVGLPTLDRGVAYALGGAVEQLVVSDNGAHLVSRVRGTDPRPYVVSVTLTRTPDGQLRSVQGSCSCPMAMNCKHVVATIAAAAQRDEESVNEWSRAGLATRATRATARPTSPAPRNAPALASWEHTLDTIWGGGELVDAAASEPQIGLQFEFFRPTTGVRAGLSSIRIRPVLPGQHGRWIKSGVSWSNLDYFAYRATHSNPTREQVSLLKELLALAHLTVGGPSWHYANEVVALESINSRRLWEVLRAARAAGVALVLAGKPAVDVNVHEGSATVVVDLNRVDAGLRVQPRLVMDDPPHYDAALLIGTPAHGVAYWHQADGAGQPRDLGLVPLASPLSDATHKLVLTGSVVVPSSDEPRFMERYLPRLRRIIDVDSLDGSVTLPEVRPLTLRLRVVGAGHLELDVHWSTVFDGVIEPLRLRYGADHPIAREGDALLTAVTAVAHAESDLVVTTPWGERLAPDAWLRGMSAVTFATTTLPALSAIEGVEVVREGLEVDYREATEPPMVHVDGAPSSDADWFDLSVSVTVGEEEVPFVELFRSLARGDSHLVLPSGTYFSLDREELRSLAQLIDEARAMGDPKVAAVRLSRFHVSYWQELERLGVLGSQAAQWESSVRRLATATDRPEVAVPKKLRATLRPYQVEGFRWLAYLHEYDLGGVLADDMGLGKTLQALALVCHVVARDPSAPPFLVVAPTSVVGNWVRECERFAPHLHVAHLSETARKRATTVRELAEGCQVVVTSYSLFRLEYPSYEEVRWSGLFLDEAQFAKNRHSQAYVKARALPVRCKVAMSGTPIENNLMELWSLLSIAAPGLFANADRFSEYYRVPIERHQDEQRLDQLRRRIRPLLLRRTKEQVAQDLPDKQEQVLELELHPRHHKVYQRLLQRERQKVLGLLSDVDRNRFAIFRSLTLLRQASLDVSLIDDEYAGIPSTKLDALMEMLEDIVGDGHRVLVFSQFTRFLTAARGRIREAGYDHCYLDGRTRDRAKVIATFRDGDAPVFLISLKAGGFGLNLTEADYCILLDPWWNPATEAQAIDRTHRIGQTRKVMVYRLVAQDTIEEKVMALKARKEALFDSVLEDGGFESGAMTADDIRGLLD